MKHMNNDKKNRTSIANEGIEAFSNKFKVGKPQMTEQQYTETFAKKSDFIAREGKQVSISEKHYDRIKSIVWAIYGGKVTMASFLDNVLNEHFKEHSQTLRAMVAEKRKKSVF